MCVPTGHFVLHQYVVLESKFTNVMEIIEHVTRQRVATFTDAQLVMTGAIFLVSREVAPALSVAMIMVWTVQPRIPMTLVKILNVTRFH